VAKQAGSQPKRPLLGPRRGESVVRRLILIALMACVGSAGMAQRGFSGGHAGAHFGGHFASHHRGHSRGWGAYPLGPLYWDSLFSDDSLDSAYAPLAPPVVVVPPPAAAQPEMATSAPRDAESVQPLLIELRNGRYVRVRGDESSISENTDQQVDLNTSRTMEPSRPSAPPPSTILIFRDGTRQQITDYTIANGVLYAEANYYTEGSWNKPIALSSLNLAATVNENRARGVPFQVPAAPNQVIVGP
jgi:hypothetical protein